MTDPVDVETNRYLDNLFGEDGDWHPDDAADFLRDMDE